MHVLKQLWFRRILSLVNFQSLTVNFDLQHLILTDQTDLEVLAHFDERNYNKMFEL